MKPMERWRLILPLSSSLNQGVAKDLHVESVMKVAVIDDAELPQSDTAIEACMENFVGVRVWNWRRVNLCIDVIACSSLDGDRPHLGY